MVRTALSVGVGSIVLVAIASLLWLWLSSEEALAPTGPAAPETARLSADETDPFKGERDAPVTVVVASSFGCPHCKDSAGILDQLLSLYPDKVRIVWKDLPESVGDSYRAALAARCAQQQGRFWQYHDTLYRNQDILATRALYGLWARELGLKEDIFNACFDEGQTKILVDRNIQQALAAGVDQVPYFQINEDEALSGPQTLTYLRGIIDLILSEASE